MKYCLLNHFALFIYKVAKIRDYSINICFYTLHNRSKLSGMRIELCLRELQICNWSAQRVYLLQLDCYSNGGMDNLVSFFSCYERHLIMEPFVVSQQKVWMQCSSTFDEFFQHTWWYTQGVNNLPDFKSNFTWPYYV